MLVVREDLHLSELRLSGRRFDGLDSLLKLLRGFWFGFEWVVYGFVEDLKVFIQIIVQNIELPWSIFWGWLLVVFLSTQSAAHKGGFWRFIWGLLSLLSVFNSASWQLLVPGLGVDRVVVKKQWVWVQGVVSRIPIRLYVSDFTDLWWELALIVQRYILVHLSVRHQQADYAVHQSFNCRTKRRSNILSGFKLR